MPIGYNEQFLVFLLAKVEFSHKIDLAVLLKSKYKTMLLLGIFVCFSICVLFVCLINKVSTDYTNPRSRKVADKLVGSIAPKYTVNCSFIYSLI